MFQKIMNHRINMVENLSINSKDVIKIIALVENSNDLTIRVYCINKIIEFQLKDDKIFFLLESCLVSDEIAIVRAAAAKALLQNFPEKSSRVITWALDNDKSTLVIYEIIDSLKEYYLILDKSLMNRFSMLEIKEKKILNFYIDTMKKLGFSELDDLAFELPFYKIFKKGYEDYFDYKNLWQVFLDQFKQTLRRRL